MLSPDQLRRRLLAADPDGQLGAALELAERLHADQRRPGGEAYLNHLLRVAYALLEMGLDANYLMAGLLHDSLEDQHQGLAPSPEEAGRILEERFGAQVAELVRAVTKTGGESYRVQLEGLFRHHPEAIPLKLCDYLDNAGSLEQLSDADRRERLQGKYGSVWQLFRDHLSSVPAPARALFEERLLQLRPGLR